MSSHVSATTEICMGASPPTPCSCALPRPCCPLPAVNAALVDRVQQHFFEGQQHLFEISGVVLLISFSDAT